MLKLIKKVYWKQYLCEYYCIQIEVLDIFYITSGQCEIYNITSIIIHVWEKKLLL